MKENKKFYYIVKRLLDIFFSFIFLVVSIPIFIIVAVLIKIEDGGTVFYKQERIGYKRKKFNCYKFRSMSEKEQNILDKSNKDYDLFVKFTKEDSLRITKIGKFLRKYSIDELPQLINVLKGEMSLVGPRPMVESEIIQIEKNYYKSNITKYFTVLPGITGLWQVSGRSSISRRRRIILELFYVDKCSLLYDIKILLKTPVAVISHKGAM